MSVLAAGFRPCKICKPAENAETAPDMVSQAIELLRNNPEEKITDWQLKQHNISPELVRRWFTKHYGFTFQAFQRMLRINGAMQALKEGWRVTDVALEHGYTSLSGFGYTFKKLLGQAPMHYQNSLVISRFTTPLGPMFVGASERGICLLEFTDRRMLETELPDLQKRFKAIFVYGDNVHTLQLQQELTEYFAGTRQQFDVSLDLMGTDFQIQVWRQLCVIPYGATVSYQQQAEAINNPSAVRAVARANGANRISIVIPCHRVIGKDGSLTGYAGGLPRKQWLLSHEKGEQMVLGL